MSQFITGEIKFKPEELIGQKLVKYQINEILGRGGMGVVFKVWDTLEEEYKAIKILPPEIAHADLALEDLKREVKSARSITHANIVKIFSLEQEGDLYFIVMEYVKGENLAKKLARTEERKLKEEDVVEIMKQLSEGIDAAHKNNVIHRDLKPQNIMITEDSKVKILDFGISYQVARSTAQITGEPPKTGTWPYMAPEQLSNKFGRENQQVDIWGFGATVYHLLTGEVPFRLKEQITDPEEKPFEIEGVSKKNRDIVMKCLEKDRSKRFSGMDQIMEALTSKEKEEPLQKEIEEEPLPDRKVDEEKEVAEEFPEKPSSIIRNFPSVTEKFYKKTPPVFVKKILERPLVAVFVVLIGFLLGILILVSIHQSSVKKDLADWKEAQRVDTIETYNGYLKNHPSGKYADLAKKSINMLTEKQRKREEERKNYEKFYSLARKNYETGDYEKALEYINRAKNTANTYELKNPEVAINLANLEMDINEKKKKKNAEEEYNEIYTLAKEYYEKGKLEEAISCLNKAKEIKTTNELRALEGKIKDQARDRKEEKSKTGKESTKITSDKGSVFVKKANKLYLRTATGKEYGPFDRVVNRSFSKDKKRWLSKVEANKRFFLVTSEGEEHGPYFEVWDLSISPDGSRWLAKFEKREGSFMVTSERKIYGPYIKIKNLSVSLDKSKWVVLTEKDEKSYLLTNNGKRLGPYNRMHEFFTSPDKKRWLAKMEYNGQYFMVTSNERIYGSYIKIYEIFKTKDLSTWFTRVYKYTNKYYLLTSKGVEDGPYHRIQLEVAADNKRWVALVQKYMDNRTYPYYIITSDWGKYGPFNRIAEFTASQDKKKWLAHVYKERSNYILTSDGVMFGPYEGVYLKYKKITGQKINWLVTVTKARKNYIATHEGKEYGPYDYVEYVRVSQDAAKWTAKGFKNRKTFMITNKGSEYGPYDSVKYFKFPRYSNKWVAEAKKGKYTYVLSSEGNEFGPYDYVDRLSIADNGSKWWAKIKKGDNYYSATGEGGEIFLKKL